MQASTYTVTKCLETFWENIMGGGTCGYDIGINFKEKKKAIQTWGGAGAGVGETGGKHKEGSTQT